MADEESKKVTIDEKEYDSEKLSEEAKGQIVNLQVVDQDSIAGCSQSKRDGSANAAAGSGNEGNFIVQFEIHKFISPKTVIINKKQN